MKAVEAGSAAEKGESLPSWSWPVFALLVLGLYLLQHPYLGLVHDSRIYTLQALNHLHPGLFSGDIFFRDGAQDRFTVFPLLHAGLIAALGAEYAASLLTFTTAIALLAAAWWLARAMMPARMAWVAVGLIALLPGFYGSGFVFSYLEGFVTPRQLAECLVLASLALWLRERRWSASLLMMVALAVHPIITFPGMVLICAAEWSGRRWRLAWSAALLAILLAGSALAGWLPLAGWQFDAEWMRALGHSAYLRLGNWSAHEWTGVANVVVTLALAALCLQGAARRYSLAMLATCLSLLLLAWIGGDLLHLRIIVQGQAWRVLWLATVMAILCLPLLASMSWQAGALRRCAFILLAGAWMAGAKTVALPFLLAALLAYACSATQFAARHDGLLRRTAWILLAVVVLCGLAMAWTDVNAAAPEQAGWLARTRSASESGLLPCAALLFLWYTLGRAGARRILPVVAVLTALPVATVASAAARPWVTRIYSPDTWRAFADWRSAIPPRAEVLWAAPVVPKNDPVAVWLLLERPSYFSSIQSVTGLFSRSAALEIQERAARIPAALPVEYPYLIVPAADHAALDCGVLPARYIVTAVRITGAVSVPPAAPLPPPFDSLKLYTCP